MPTGARSASCRRRPTASCSAIRSSTTSSRTVGSYSVTGYYEPMRLAGHQARQVLLANAAETLKVPVGELTHRAGLRRSRQVETQARLRRDRQDRQGAESAAGRDQGRSQAELAVSG